MLKRYHYYKKAFMLIGITVFAISQTPVYAKEHIVKVKSGKSDEMRFDPENITVKQGDTVTWINEKAIYHNIRSLPGDIPKGAEQLKSPSLRNKDDRWSYTFSIVGKYDYFCVPHRTMGMVGSVTVEPQ